MAPFPRIGEPSSGHPGVPRSGDSTLDPLEPSFDPRGLALPPRARAPPASSLPRPPPPPAPPGGGEIPAGASLALEQARAAASRTWVMADCTPDWGGRCGLWTDRLAANKVIDRPPLG